MNQLVVLEGLSGTGKTTISRLLADIMGAHQYTTPPSLFDLAREEIDKKADNISRFLFYLSGIFYASKEIEKILREKSVVCDRYVLTTICYHRALGVLINIPQSFLQQIIKPSHVFLVVCEENERRKRLDKRGLTQNDIIERRLDIDTKFLEEYKKHEVTEIDNSSNNPHVAVEQVLRVIGG